MVDIRVRRADLEDAGGVATVHVASWQAAYRGLIDQEVLDRLEVDQRTDGWSRWIAASLSGQATEGPAGPSHRLLVAEIGDRIVGWAGFGSGRDPGMGQLGELAGLYVHPEFWSQRVGHTLLGRVEEELLPAGFESAFLWVLRGNDRAAEFYDRHGWIADGQTKLGAAGGAQQLEELRHVRQLRAIER